MSKFNIRPAPDPFGRAGIGAGGASPIVADRTPSTTTFEGAAAFLRAPRGELFLTATAGFVAEDKFYETGDATVQRVRELAATIAAEAGPIRKLTGAYTGRAVDVRTGQVHEEKTDTGLAWMLPCVHWMRHQGNVRTAPIIIAVEAVHARLTAGIHGGNRELIRACLLRADEPGELIMYWIMRFGRAIPQCVKRGIADMLPILYTQYSALKYDTNRHAMRFGDVVELVHPTDGRDTFYRWLIDRRHDRADAVEITVPGGELPMIRYRHELDAWPVAERRAWLRNAAQAGEIGDRLNAAGATWEWVSGWLSDGKGMDAAAWEAVIPSMGYMARLRNLRNFDQAGVHPAVLDAIAARLMDPAQVAKSRQFPFRFLSAFRAAPSLRWGHPLDQALTLSTQNIPTLPGRTAVYIDTSASMRHGMSGKSDIEMVDAASLFGVATWSANRHGGGQVDLYGFGDGVFEHKPTIGGSLIKEVEAFRAKVGSVGHGTNLVSAIRNTLTAEHTRVMVFSDMQIMNEPDSDTWRSQYRRSLYDRTPAEKPAMVTDVVPTHVPLYTWNLEGYRQTPIPGQTPNRFELGGLTDATFRLIPVIEAGQSGRWPWEQSNRNEG